MPPYQNTADSELGIWERVFIPDPKHISRDQAHYLLEVRFPQADLNRINQLSAKAREGSLSPEESKELEHYVHVGHLLSILKAKVLRVALRQSLIELGVFPPQES